MFKKLAALALTAFATVTLAACGSSSSQDTLEKIEEKGKIVVAVSPDYAPFEFQALVDGKNQVVGSDILLAQEIADELGVELEISTMSFNNVLNSLNDGSADIAISGLSYTEERAEVFDFSEAYYETQNAFLVRQSDASSIKSLDDLAGKKVAALKGSIEETLSKEQLTDSTVTGLTPMGEAIAELKSGQIDAVNLEEPVAIGYAAQNDDLVVLENVSLSVSDGDAKAIAMPKGSDALKEKIDAVIKRLVEENKYEEFLKEAAQYTEVEAEE